MSLSRILIAGLSGGSGKTVVSTGLCAYFRKKGYTVAPFKKGPDYIDSAWLAEASNQPCRNLDLYFHTPETILRSFQAGSTNADISVIEGNRGLYDGMDSMGTFSTAELAKLLKAPVILTIDCTKMTRTIAAIVLGCQKLDPDVPLAGVVLNKIGGPRHESVLRKSIEKACGIPVLGALPRNRGFQFPERHLGLVPPQEHGKVSSAVEISASLAEEYLDTEKILEIASKSETIDNIPIEPVSVPADVKARIGVFRDAAFQFYYPENLEAIQNEGGKIVEISPLKDPHLPPVDALYIGGGFPESLATSLSANEQFRNSVKESVKQGLPVYAECGGAVFLGDKLNYEGKEYPMAGVFPVDYHFGKKPRGHGYAELEALEGNPFLIPGTVIRGHEFHYTYTRPEDCEKLSFGFKVLRGYGFDGKKDGLVRGNVMASYTHIHALGVSSWAKSLVTKAVEYTSSKES